MWYKILFLVLSLLMLPGANAHAQCMKAGVTPEGLVVFNSTGNTMLDAAITGEAAQLSAVFGVSPSLYTMDDSQASNAYANCGRMMVTIGLRLLKEELWSMNKGEMAVAGILAHEYAHIYQCKNQNSMSTKLKELQADFLAGWYLKKTKGSMGINVSGFAQSLYEKGDYDFRNPQHHGTPEERVAAFAAGFTSSDSSVAQAYKSGERHVKGEKAIGTVQANQPKVCERRVPCQHRTQCVHMVPCQHRTACVHSVPCQHIIQASRAVPCSHTMMTPMGPQPMHQYDQQYYANPIHAFDIPHAFDPQHEVDIAHPNGDRLHEFDVVQEVCP